MQAYFKIVLYEKFLGGFFEFVTNTWCLKSYKIYCLITIKVIKRYLKFSFYDLKLKPVIAVFTNASFTTH